MKNADRPMNPVEVSGDGEGNIQGIQTGNYSGWETGLTKREYFSGLAMQAADLEKYADAFGDKWAERVAKDSVIMADALLKELETKLD